MYEEAMEHSETLCRYEFNICLIVPKLSIALWVGRWNLLITISNLGYLGRRVDDLSKSVTDMLVRQKQVSTILKSFRPFYYILFSPKNVSMNTIMFRHSQFILGNCWNAPT